MPMMPRAGAQRVLLTGFHTMAMLRRQTLRSGTSNSETAILWLCDIGLVI